ncbi:Multiprotein-bridging factor 1c [Datura stramonium]|uniref:Multiprotein-bridging factor 1c n=1 Tax=Datura stramonium TaxID=4076 RepID=A0ABS8SR24_DATST|nr:Multiprotein-bridging factor 1c [Datura stramonium]
MPMRSTGGLKQEWEPVVLHKRKVKAQDLRDPKAVNQALRTGAQVQTVKKFDAGLNKKAAAAATAVNARKLDEAAEPAALEKVPVDVRQAIQKARIEKKMSQADLAKQINERTQVVAEYENGKAVPNQLVLGKMEKVLGVKLRGIYGEEKRRSFAGSYGGQREGRGSWVFSGGQWSRQVGVRTREDWSGEGDPVVAVLVLFG